MRHAVLHWKIVFATQHLRQAPSRINLRGTEVGYTALCIGCGLKCYPEKAAVQVQIDRTAIGPDRVSSMICGVVHFNDPKHLAEAVDQKMVGALFLHLSCKRPADTHKVLILFLVEGILRTLSGMVDDSDRIRVPLGAWLHVVAAIENLIEPVLVLNSESVIDPKPITVKFIRIGAID